MSYINFSINPESISSSQPQYSADRYPASAEKAKAPELGHEDPVSNDDYRLSLSTCVMSEINSIKQTLANLAGETSSIKQTLDNLAGAVNDVKLMLMNHGFKLDKLNLGISSCSEANAAFLTDNNAPVTVFDGLSGNDFSGPSFSGAIYSCGEFELNSGVYNGAFYNPTSLIYTT